MAIPPVVARILSGDSTSPLTREGKRDGAKRGIVRMLNKQSVYKASVVVRGKGLLSFCNGCEDDSIRCNGRGKKGK